MDRLSLSDIEGLSLATEELAELCRILELQPPYDSERDPDVVTGDGAEAVARRTLLARKLTVAHRHGVVVHPAVAAVVQAVAAPAVVVRIEVERGGDPLTDVVSISGDHDLLVEHRCSTSLGVHHLGVIEDGALMARVGLAAGLEAGPVADVPGFTVKSSALRTALRELEAGCPGAALDALIGSGAPVRPARAFAAAASGRSRTVVVATIWRDHERTARSTTAWIDGGALGMWRIPGGNAGGATALVEPVTAARLAVEIAAALPGRFGRRNADDYGMAGVATSARS